MIESLIIFLHNFPPETILLMEYLICCATISILVYFFKYAGLFVYISSATIVANIQVLKAVDFTYLNYPVALGTITFSSVFLATDVLTEFYGAAKARGAIWLSFCASLFFTLITLITLGLKPAPISTAINQAMQLIFLPSVRIFAASLISYVISQQLDILIFQKIKLLTQDKHLWLRTVFALLISALIDNIIFSSLAFVVFSEHPISFHELTHTYIIGTYIFRIIVSLLQVPIMYFIRKIIHRKLNDII